MFSLIDPDVLSSQKVKTNIAPLLPVLSYKISKNLYKSRDWMDCCNIMCCLLIEDNNIPGFDGL